MTDVKELSIDNQDKGNMKYPSTIHFEPTDDGILAKYKQDIAKRKIPKYNLGVWAISYLLNEGLYRDDRANVMYLDIIDVTMALRLSFLSKAALFKNIEFEGHHLDTAIEKADDILNNIGASKKYITYGKEYDFSKRGTKKKAESLLEKDICDNISTLFGNEFLAPAPLIRQFPANIFKRVISKDTRVTRKFWIDALTVNSFSQLSVIELKAGGNAPLDLLIQAIDYGIVCHLFKSHYADCWFSEMGGVNQNKIAIYCVAEKFHPAIIGNKDFIGIKSVIQRNDFFDIILIKINVKNNNVEGTPTILFDTRKL